MKNYIIIFLYFDGVVNTQNSYGFDLCMYWKDKRYPKRKEIEFNFDPKCITPLKQLIEFCKKSKGQSVEYKIVVCSTWRMMLDAQDFNNMFQKYLHIYPRQSKLDVFIGITDIDNNDRGMQIKNYINNFNIKSKKSKIKDWLIIDDEADHRSITDYQARDRIFKIDGLIGLNEAYLNRIISILESKKEDILYNIKTGTETC